LTVNPGLSVDCDVVVVTIVDGFFG
jgi:hypothetical protein